MEIAIISGGMANGPNTLEHYSLGGSETASLQMAKELKKLGHIVRYFTNLPTQPRLDATKHGTLGDDGVLYMDLASAGEFLVATEVDLLIASRNPQFLAMPHQAKKAVLWLHDLATYKDFAGMFNSMAALWDETWCVSEYHRQQLHKVTGYPLDKIWATRNGIARYGIAEDVFGVVPRQLLYAARPERGLLNLVRPGGIMERLPDFNLVVCTYDNFPPHMQGFYEMVFRRCSELPNVKLLPPQKQSDLRSLMAESWAYVYPTSFEEVSCIIAREAIEQHLPFIATRIGALPETLGEAGIFYDCARSEIGSDEFCQGFAELVKGLWDRAKSADCAIERAKLAASKRTDLYWDDVAASWIGRANPPLANPYSMVRSLLEDSDIIPAIAYLNSLQATEKTAGVRWVQNQIETLYPYLYGRETFHDYYARYYQLEDEKGARGKPQMEGNPRFEAIAAEIAKLPDGSRVLDYGCAEGVICNALAKRFPNKKFVAVDFNDGNISLATKYAAEDGLSNIAFKYIKETDEIEALGGGFDAAICSEVLEHVTEPWSLIDRLERECNLGARIVITVPAGPWEATGLYNKKQFPWRAHIWHVTKWMLRKMFADKEGCNLNTQYTTTWRDGRSIGHTVFSFSTNGKPSQPVDPLEKAMSHRARQTCAAAIIAKDAQGEIRRCLDTITEDVHQVQIALGPCTDYTERDIKEWAEDNPWVEVRVVNVPAISNRSFGFDDARNASIAGIEADWIFWIDTDEYVSGSFKKYLRDNAFDSYAVHQHHFTCDPRGAPAQLDKPARLFRNNGTFTFYGKVHEHAEKGFNNGPGFAMILPDVDIGHTGYVNESVRKLRFHRNFPFLQWDREVYPDRKLGQFLWLRDLIHLMRDAAAVGNQPEARRLAQEAVDFYSKTSDRYQYIGSGVQTTLDYVSEAKHLLGDGSLVRVNIDLPNDQKHMGYHGIFSSADQALEVAKKLLGDEFDRRNSGYWQ